MFTHLKAAVIAAVDRFRIDAGEMSRADRAAWERADSLAAIGELTAQWLEGTLRSQPGYCGPVDTDENEAPGMTALLARLNRAGYVTNSSQAGSELPSGSSCDSWRQHAAVSGFADPQTLTILQEIVAATPGLKLVRCHHRRYGEPLIAAVTFHGDIAVTDFGNAASRRDLADEWVGYGVCTPEGVRQVIAAAQVVVLDTVVGRNSVLWPALERAADRLAVAE